MAGTRYATLAVRENLKRNVKSMEAARTNPEAWQKIQDKPQFESKLSKAKATLERVTPPDLAGSDADRVAKRKAALTEAMVKGNSAVPPMPSERQMWRAGAGAVGQWTTWENYWKRHNLDAKGNAVRIDPAKQRGAIFELKDHSRALAREREEYDPDVGSIEMIRPKTDSSPLMDVPLRSYGLSAIAKESYDEVFPDHTPTPVEEKIAEAKAQLTTFAQCVVPGKKGPCKGKPVSATKPYCFAHKRKFEASASTATEE